MPFLTRDQIRKVRIKGSKVMKFDALDGAELRIVKMSSSAQLQAQEIQKSVADGKLSTRDFLLFVVKNVCADINGDLLSESEATDVFDLLPLNDITSIVNESAAMISSSVKIRLKDGEAEVESAPLTETEKK